MLFTEATKKKLSLIFLLGIIFIGIFVNFVNKFALSDDNLYLYHSTFTLVSENSNAIEAERKINKDSSQFETEDTKIFSNRWSMRADYVGNYLASIYLYSSGAKVARAFSDSGKFAPKILSNIISAFLLPLLIFSVLFILFIYRWNNSIAFLGILFTLVVVYFTNEYIPRGGQNLYDYGVVNFFKFIINPGYGLTPLGFTPRNHFMLMSIPVFLLWIRNKVYLAYLGMLLLLFVHNSMAFILMTFLFSTDVFFRINKIFRLNVAFLFFAIALSYLGREQLFNVANQHLLLLISLFFLVCSIVVTIIYKQKDYQSGESFDAKLIIKLCSSIVALWIAVFGFVFFFSFFLPDTTFPVWYIFPGRSLAVIRPLILLGGFIAILCLFYKKNLVWEHVFKITFISFLLVLMSGYHQVGGKVGKFLESLNTDIKVLDSKVNTSLSYVKDNERFFYYRLIKNQEHRIIELSKTIL